MQDRFKFRVWSKDCSEYVEENSDWCHIDYNGNLDCGCVEDKDYDCGYSGYSEDDAIIEQCTGLKDKNGKLIYEGDIVKNNKHIYQVEWYVNGFAVNDGYDYLIDNEEWEIIGTVHENPELLEKSDE